MRTKVSKLIFTATTIEIIGALLISSFFYTLFFGVHETITMLKWLYPHLFIGSIFSYALGWLIGQSFSANYQFKKWQGVVIMFALLLAGIFAAMFSLSASSQNDISSFMDFVPVILVFLAFGGIPTLFLGLWLGKQLKGKQV